MLNPRSSQNSSKFIKTLPFRPQNFCLSAPMTATPRTPQSPKSNLRHPCADQLIRLPSSNTHYNPAHDCRRRRSESRSLKVKHTTRRHDSCFTLTPSEPQLTLHACNWTVYQASQSRLLCTAGHCSLHSYSQSLQHLLKAYKVHNKVYVQGKLCSITSRFFFAHRMSSQVFRPWVSRLLVPIVTKFSKHCSTLIVHPH